MSFSDHLWAQYADLALVKVMGGLSLIKMDSFREHTSWLIFNTPPTTVRIMSWTQENLRVDFHIIPCLFGIFKRSFTSTNFSFPEASTISPHALYTGISLAWHCGFFKSQMMIANWYILRWAIVNSSGRLTGGLTIQINPNRSYSQPFTYIIGFRIPCSIP